MEKSQKKVKHLPSFILRSRYRKEIFFKLLEKPFQTQSQLLKDSTIKYRPHMARTIKELLDEELIECENPNETMYKMYKPKAKAFQVKEELNKYSQTDKE